MSDQQPPIAIIKLGGSSITVKSQFETLNENGLAHAVACISTAVQNGYQCIIVHGAGSFGHFQAKLYQVSSGIGTQHARSRMGFSLTRASVQKLNNHVVEQLSKQGVPAISAPALPRWRTAGKQLADCADGIAHVRALLAMGCIPVLHGDVVLDSQQGIAVLSGDVIVEALCDALAPSRVVFLCDVDGVYTHPPGTQVGGHDPERIPVVQVFDDGSYSVGACMTAAAHDVTGGIEAKVATAVRIVSKSGVDVLIANVSSPSAIQAVSRGSLLTESFGGTIVTRNASPLSPSQ